MIKIVNDGDYYRDILTPESKESMVVYGNTTGTYYNSLQEAINSCTNKDVHYYLTMINGITDSNFEISANCR